MLRRYNIPQAAQAVMAKGQIRPMKITSADSNVEITVDLAHQTSVDLTARRPDLVVLNKKERTVEIFEVACLLGQVNRGARRGERDKISITCGGISSPPAVG